MLLCYGFHWQKIKVFNTPKPCNLDIFRSGSFFGSSRAKFVHVVWSEAVGFLWVHTQDSISK